MADKDVDRVIAALAASNALRDARVICTAIDAPRAMPADTLASRWQTLADVARVEAVVPAKAALDRAMARTGEGPLVVAGSLYLVGMVRGLLVDDPDLRDPAPNRSR
jgi:folylpolyglutamate synthase/dihydropteroate synthase